jgi:hypothetical protein
VNSEICRRRGLVFLTATTRVTSPPYVSLSAWHHIDAFGSGFGRRGGGGELDFSGRVSRVEGRRRVSSVVLGKTSLGRWMDNGQPRLGQGYPFVRSYRDRRIAGKRPGSDPEALLCDRIRSVGFGSDDRDYVSIRAGVVLIWCAHLRSGGRY